MEGGGRLANRLGGNTDERDSFILFFMRREALRTPYVVEAQSKRAASTAKKETKYDDGNCTCFLYQVLLERSMREAQTRSENEGLLSTTLRNFTLDGGAFQNRYMLRTLAHFAALVSSDSFDSHRIANHKQ